MQALFVENLTVIDFAYFDIQRGIVGESLILDLELFGELNDEGMLFDFSFVKKRIKVCVDNLVDHKFLVAKNQTDLKMDNTPQSLDLELTTINGEFFQHCSPHQAVCMLDDEQVTPASLEKLLEKEIKTILPDNVTRVQIRLRPEESDDAYYHYSHGLKKHFGDCQRIAHGPRSNIKVWQNQIYSRSLSLEIASMWKDIYIASAEDIKETREIESVPYYVFEYIANQGLFQLTIPQHRCYLIETDTTIELIAKFLAEYLKKRAPKSQFKVKVFEGVDKGAIFSV